MQRTEISWTNFSSNPLKYRDPDGNVVHACIHKSAGCLHCYAETLAGRWGKAGNKFTVENMKRLTPFLDEKELHHMLTHKPASGKMCFVGDMTDIFGEWVPDELLDQLFAVLVRRYDVIWQLLTKRSERMLEYCTSIYARRAQAGLHGPFPNVWLGVSCEDQKTADERLMILRDIPNAVPWVSYEPALAGVDFSAHLDFLRWIVCGGESGPGARPFNIQWARDVIAQCKAAGTKAFFKQAGSNAVLDNKRIRLMDRKGGDWTEWEEDLKVREYPLS